MYTCYYNHTCNIAMTSLSSRIKESISFICLYLTTVTLSFAQNLNSIVIDGETLFERVVNEILNPIYQFMVAIAALYFLYGVAKFIYDLNDPEKKNFGKSHLLYGMIGMFIILSVGGILPWLNGIIGGMFQY